MWVRGPPGAAAAVETGPPRGAASAKRREWMLVREGSSGLAMCRGLEAGGQVHVPSRQPVGKALRTPDTLPRQPGPRALTAEEGDPPERRGGLTCRSRRRSTPPAPTGFGP